VLQRFVDDENLTGNRWEVPWKNVLSVINRKKENTGADIANGCLSAPTPNVALKLKRLETPVRAVDCCLKIILFGAKCIAVVRNAKKSRVCLITSAVFVITGLAARPVAIR